MSTTMEKEPYTIIDVDKKGEINGPPLQPSSNNEESKNFNLAGFLVAAVILTVASQNPLSIGVPLAAVGLAIGITISNIPSSKAMAEIKKKEEKEIDEFLSKDVGEMEKFLKKKENEIGPDEVKQFLGKSLERTKVVLENRERFKEGDMKGIDTLPKKEEFLKYKREMLSKKEASLKKEEMKPNEDKKEKRAGKQL